MKSYLIIAGLSLAWLVTPESLVLLGKVSGDSGILVIIPLIFGVVLACFSAALIHDKRLSRDGKGGEYTPLISVYGRAVAATIMMSGRVPMLLFATTGMLVSAGFAFNEIFAYWFPNFLFASLLLLMICVLNIFDEKYALHGQLFFVGLSFIGILILIIIGVGGRDQANTLTLLPVHELSLSHFGFVFLVFLSFDFCQTKERGVTPVIITLMLAFLLLAGWAMLAVGFVDQEKLADSSISHLLIARVVGGEVGRYIMGAVIICGALSGVNGLFIVLRRTFVEMAEEKMFPKVIGYGWPTIVFFAIFVESMMMTGFAGEEILETQIRASLLLWLLYLGLRSYAAGLLLGRMGAGGRIMGSIVGGVILLIMVCLTVVDTDAGYIVRFNVVSVIVFFIFSFVWMNTYGRVFQKY